MRMLALMVGLVGVFLPLFPTLVSADELLPANESISSAIDHYIQRKLQEDNVAVASMADDANLVRRLTLDLAGRIPTVSEAKGYVDSDDADKRASLVDGLIASPDFAYHHRNQLDIMLAANKNGDNEFRKYLFDAVSENRTWDQMFREMMLGREGDEAKKPELAFLSSRSKSIDDMTNDTSRIFFGVNISCAKCHDHPLVADWQQDHFYGMQSFFNRTYQTKSKRLAEKYSGELKFKTTEGEEKQAKFMFLTGSVVEEPATEKSDDERKKLEEEVKRQMKDDKAPAPPLPEFSPRSTLVELALRAEDREFFARAIVIRMWARFFSRGLVDPLDQMHSENPPSHPDLLAWLARDLVDHNYDLKRLIQGIVLSDAYARSSRWDGEGEVPSDEYFAVATVRPMSPRQYSLSLIIASSNPDSFAADPKPDEWAKRREQLENSANGLAGQIEAPGENFQVSVDEALLISNSERVQNDYLRDSKDRLIGHLKEVENRRERIEAAFWSVYSRAPTEDEIVAFESYLSDQEGDEKDIVPGLRQVVWALMAGPELRFNY